MYRIDRLDMVRPSSIGFSLIEPQDTIPADIARTESEYREIIVLQNVFVMAAAWLRSFSGVVEELQAACHPLLVVPWR